MKDQEVRSLYNWTAETLSQFALPQHERAIGRPFRADAGFSVSAVSARPQKLRPVLCLRCHETDQQLKREDGRQKGAIHRLRIRGMRNASNKTAITTIQSHGMLGFLGFLNSRSTNLSKSKSSSANPNWSVAPFSDQPVFSSEPHSGQARAFRGTSAPQLGQF